MDICCLTDFQALIESRGLDGHGIYYYVPALLKHFTTAQINALIAPRPHLALAGDVRPAHPAAGLDRIEAELTAVYAEQGAAPGAWRLSRSATGHFETASMREEIPSVPSPVAVRPGLSPRSSICSPAAGACRGDWSWPGSERWQASTIGSPPPARSRSITRPRPRSRRTSLELDAVRTDGGNRGQGRRRGLPDRRPAVPGVFEECSRGLPVS